METVPSTDAVDSFATVGSIIANEVDWDVIVPPRPGWLSPVWIGTACVVMLALYVFSGLLPW